MIKKIIDKLEIFLKIKEPEFPPQTNYEIVSNYLIKTHKASIKYYKLILKIGLFGLFLSIGLLFYLVGEKSCLEESGLWNWDIKHWKWEIIFKVKEYPAIIASLITMSFGHLEMEEKKKELYKHLLYISTEFKEKKDHNSIVEDYKKWTWSEFQDKFKPE